MDMGIDIFKYGWVYDAILFMMFAVFVTDAIGIIRNVMAGKEALAEYASLIIKYLRIILQIFAAVFFLYVAISGKYDGSTNAIHVVVAIATLIDAGASLFIKIKYRKGSSTAVKRKKRRK